MESLVRGVSVVQLVFGLSNPRQSANFHLVKPKIRARIGQNVCPIRGEFAAGERFHQGQHISDDTSSAAVNLCDWNFEQKTELLPALLTLLALLQLRINPQISTCGLICLRNIVYAYNGTTMQPIRSHTCCCQRRDHFLLRRCAWQCFKKHLFENLARDVHHVPSAN